MSYNPRPFCHKKNARHSLRVTFALRQRYSRTRRKMRLLRSCNAVTQNQTAFAYAGGRGYAGLVCRYSVTPLRFFFFSLKNKRLTEKKCNAFAEGVAVRAENNKIMGF